MAEKPRGYGMTAELEAKKAAKFDPEQAQIVFEWIATIIGDENAKPKEYNQKDICQILKDGEILCKLMNALLNVMSSPLAPIKMHTKTTMAFKQMENIGKFLDYCCKLDCKREDLFQTVDLYDCSNIQQVINGILALGRKVNKSFPGDGIGPKESTKNERTFSQETLNAGKHVIGLQAGSNKGASQSGQSFGLGRQIL